MSIAARARVLLAGASGDIGRAVLRVLAEEHAVVGAHYHQNASAMSDALAEAGGARDAAVRAFAADLSTQAACHRLVDDFVEWAGGIDALVQVTGNVTRPCGWDELTEAHWLADLNVNLSGPFFLSQRAMTHMRARGGRIVLTSTASASHGGGANSIAYGVAKAGVECLAKGLARIGAPHGILVNVVAPGFIDTQFQTKRMRRGPADIGERIALVPLKRAGTPDDVARLIAYLLSPHAGFITGECIKVSGGDWL